MIDFVISFAVVWTFFSAIIGLGSVAFFINTGHHGDRKAAYSSITKELRECVVDGHCPLGDSAFHRLMDKMHWSLICHWKAKGAHFGFWFRNFLTVLLLVPMLQERSRPKIPTK